MSQDPAFGHDFAKCRVLTNLVSEERNVKQVAAKVQLGEADAGIVYTTSAVVMAQVSVAGPFYIRGAKLGFASIESEIEESVAIDGASTLSGFRHVTLPLALPRIASGILLFLARAVSEFGATLMFAGNFACRTQTLSLVIMAALESDLSAALALAVLLVVMAAAVLVVSRLLAGRWLDR